MTINWKAVEQYFTVVLFVFQIILDLVLSEVKGLMWNVQFSRKLSNTPVKTKALESLCGDDFNPII